MKNKAQNIQDRFLNAIRKEQIPVSIIVMNGYQIKNAKITGFDNFVILLSTENGQTMLFKHAISSIIPSKMIDMEKYKGEEEQ